MIRWPKHQTPSNVADVICERVKPVIRRAHTEGKKLGRPNAWGHPAKVATLRAEGRSLREIARELGVSAATVRRNLDSTLGVCTKYRENPHRTYVHPLRPESSNSAPDRLNFAVTIHAISVFLT